MGSARTVKSAAAALFPTRLQPALSLANYFDSSNLRIEMLAHCQDRRSYCYQWQWQTIVDSMNPRYSNEYCFDYGSVSKAQPANC